MRRNDVVIWKMVVAKVGVARHGVALLCHTHTHTHTDVNASSTFILFPDTLPASEDSDHRAICMDQDVLSEE